MSKGKTKRAIFNDMNYIELTKRGKEPSRPGAGFIIGTILKLSAGSFLLICEFLLIIMTGGSLQTALREGGSCFPAALQLLNILAATGLGIYIMSDAARRNQLKISVQVKKNAFRRIVKKCAWRLRVLFNKKTKGLK
jgi:hypothetical protein